LAEMASAWVLAGDDADIIAGLREGSETAFDWLIARYQSSVYSLVYQLVDDPNDAPDTVQEVFLKVFRAIGRFKGECALKTWIYRIAINEASNQRRWFSRHRRGELSLQTPLAMGGEADDEITLSHVLTDHGESPFDHAVNEQLREAVQNALAEVPVAFRTVVLLRDVEELSYEEIAEVLQVRVGTVKSRLARGREALRPRLALLLKQPGHSVRETAAGATPPGVAAGERGAPRPVPAYEMH